MPGNWDERNARNDLRAQWQRRTFDSNQRSRPWGQSIVRRAKAAIFSGYNSHPVFPSTDFFPPHVSVAAQASLN